MSPIVADSFAETRARSRLGIAMAALRDWGGRPPAQGPAGAHTAAPAVLRPALPSMARLPRKDGGGAPCSPPNLQGSLVTLLQNLAGRRRDGDGTQGVARGHAG